MALTDLASLRRAFFRLVDTEEEDPGLTEHDASDNEAADQLLLQGAHAAQDWMLAAGDVGMHWLTQASVPTEGSWQGSDSTDGGRWTALPADFLRLWGDEQHSALRKPNGTQWGVLIDPEYRFDVRGSKYWVEGAELWIARSASPPSDLEMDYVYQIDLTADPVDFPADYRPLIVAYAARDAVDEGWSVAEPEKVESYLERWKQRSRRRSRRTRQPRQMRQKRTTGTHWIFGR